MAQHTRAAGIPDQAAACRLDLRLALSALPLLGFPIVEVTAERLERGPAHAKGTVVAVAADRPAGPPFLDWPW